MSTEVDTQVCPYCKEEIRSGAIKCKHCSSVLRPQTPTHEGVCPYCKESINADAVKCKHCHSFVGPRGYTKACGCGRPGEALFDQVGVTVIGEDAALEGIDIPPEVGFSVAGRAGGLSGLTFPTTPGQAPGQLPPLIGRCPRGSNYECRFVPYNCHPLAAFGLHRTCYRVVCGCVSHI
jgi:hypothetical protein